MAKITDIDRYFKIVKQILTKQEVSNDDLKFYYSTTPEVNQDVIDEYVEAQRKASKDPKNFTVDPDLTSEALVQVGRLLQSDPGFKEQTLEIARATKAGKLSEKISNGINLVLGGTDIGNSVAQIRESNKLLKTRRPSRPTAPGRDQLLQQALRNAQENTFDTERAIAPVRAEIGDQYLNDIQGAKTASTGQAGAYGAYRQLAANRRNRAALQLAPIQDEIRRGQQARYDNLLGMRMDETNSMFRNQASLYPYDLEQYQNEQQAAGHLGATGRSNLRDSLYNAGAQAASTIGNNYAQARYAKLRNQSTAAGMSNEEADKYVVGADLNIRKYTEPQPFYPDYAPQTMYEQSYIH